VRRLVSDECGDMAMHLHEVVESGDVAEVRRLVAAGADVEEPRGEHGIRPLHMAAGSGHVDVMRVLVQLGADRDAKAAHGGRPLHLAAYNGHVEAVRALMQLGVDKDAEDADGATALHHAAFDGQVEAIKTLVQLGAAIDAKDKDGETPLHWAAYISQMEALRVLGQLGADVEATAANGRTPLNWAAQNGHVEAARALMQLGAAVNAPELFVLAACVSVAPLLLLFAFYVLKRLFSSARVSQPPARPARTAAAKQRARRGQKEAAATVATAKVTTRQRLEKEKETLMRKLRQVDTELGSSSNLAAAREEGAHTCVVCMDAPNDHVILPCGHMCVCGPCVEMLRQAQWPACPLCRTHITLAARVFT
jgi:hypothetical protein